MHGVFNWFIWRKFWIALAAIEFLGLQVITPVLAVNIISITTQKLITTPILTGLALSTGTAAVPLGSAAPTLAVPTSASSGAITYSSGVPGVAAIDRNTHAIDLVGIGTTVLTATQAAAGTYSSAIAMIALVVSATIAKLTPVTSDLQMVSAKVGTAITPTSDFTTTGLAGTVKYTVSPSLQTGLKMSVTGVISGTPETAQLKTQYTITATDPTAGTASSTVSITVEALQASALAVTGLSAPVTAYLPVVKTTNGTGYTGTVVWSENATVFYAMKAYTATLTLKADKGYSFSKTTKDSVNTSNFTGSKSVSNEPGSESQVVIIVSYEETLGQDIGLFIYAIGAGGAGGSGSASSGGGGGANGSWRESISSGSQLSIVVGAGGSSSIGRGGGGTGAGSTIIAGGNNASGSNGGAGGLSNTGSGGSGGNGSSQSSSATLPSDNGNGGGGGTNAPGATGVGGGGGGGAMQGAGLSGLSGRLTVSYAGALQRGTGGLVTKSTGTVSHTYEDAGSFTFLPY